MPKDNRDNCVCVNYLILFFGKIYGDVLLLVGCGVEYEHYLAAFRKYQPVANHFFLRKKHDNAGVRTPAGPTQGATLNQLDRTQLLNTVVRTSVQMKKTSHLARWAKTKKTVQPKNRCPTSASAARKVAHEREARRQRLMYVSTTCMYVSRASQAA